MRLLQGSWSEVLTLSLIFRTLPTTVAAASASAKESEAGLRRRLKFAPDFALTEAMALQIDLEEFYNHVSFTFHFIVRGKNAQKSATTCKFFIYNFYIFEFTRFKSEFLILFPPPR